MTAQRFSQTTAGNRRLGSHLRSSGERLTTPGANPLVAARAFPTSDYWGRTGVARCAEEITGICRDFNNTVRPNGITLSTHTALIKGVEVHPLN